ncbi:pyridoxamine 5'-phosphate oxidase family protein [Methyloglobulus sp.]|uniref:pyridoxamine 5'-phosphate oxidase family protein n=1 Tax=Methyloglobulus sp. TaxID=2518622 RepID=UPI0032B83DF0
MFRLFKAKPKTMPPSVAPLTLLPGSEGEHFLQQKYGTTQRALRFYDKQVLNYLSPVMKEFIGRQEVLFIATSDKHGDCDCSFRFGKPGFVKALNDNYLVYPEYRGNGVMASQGNITENPHIGMIFVDFFASTVGLHVNGKAKIVEHEDLLKFRKELPQDVVDEMNSEGKHRPERWIMVEIEEAYIHCSKHVPLLKKAEKDIAWGTDDEGLKRSDFFALQDIPLYQRIGGEPAIQAITEVVTRKLLLDEKLRPFLDEINLQTLLDRQKHFLKTAFGAYGAEQGLPENLREFYRQQTNARMSDGVMDIVLGHLNKTLVGLDVPEHEITKLMNKLEGKSAI